MAIGRVSSFNPCIDWKTIKRIPQIPVRCNMLNCTQKSLQGQSLWSWIRRNPLLMSHIPHEKSDKTCKSPQILVTQRAANMVIKPHWSPTYSGVGGGGSLWLVHYSENYVDTTTNQNYKINMGFSSYNFVNIKFNCTWNSWHFCPIFSLIISNTHQIQTVHITCMSNTLSKK